MVVEEEYDIGDLGLSGNMGNKLFCTFSTEDKVDEVVDQVVSKYTVLFNKLFVLSAKGQDDYLVTYNVDYANVSNFLPNTILVHRKKESNTLYTINAMNTLIRSENSGVLDTSYEVNWGDYRNCLLLTKGSELKRINTKLHNIIEL